MENFFRESGVKWLWGRIKTLLSAKQDKLVSGTNIKTINGTSVLGAGNITIEGGDSTGDVDEGRLVWSSEDSPSTLMDIAYLNGNGNKIAGIPPSLVTIEYSADNGATWVDSGISDANKTILTNHRINSSTNIRPNGSTTLDINYQTRITIDLIQEGTKAWVGCFEFRKIILKCSGIQKNDTHTMTIEMQKYGSTTWDIIKTSRFWGSPGFFSIPTPKRTVGYPSSSYYRKVRLTWQTGDVYTNIASINGVYFISDNTVGVGGKEPSQYAITGTPYSIDYDQNTIFPNAVKGKKLITDGGKSTQVVKGDGSLEEESALAVARAIDAEHAQEADYAGVADKADKAEKLATPRKIGLTGGAVGTATNFDGSGNINIPVTKIDEGILAWRENYAPFGTLFDNVMKIGGNNVLAFMPPSAITIEHSTDNGVTWLDYGVTDANKIKFVTPELGTYMLFLGKDSNSASASNRLRFTLDFVAAEMRFTPSKIAIKYGSLSSSTDNVHTKLSIEKYVNYNQDVWEEITDKEVTQPDWGTYILPTADWGYKSSTYRARLRCEVYRTTDSVNKTNLTNIIIMATKIVRASNYAQNRHLYSFDYQQNATFPNAIKGKKLITDGGTNQQVVLGDGSLKALSEISPITDADADILLDNHIHSINVKTNGNYVNIIVIESSKNGNTWETEDNDIPIPLATTTSAGVMSKEDKAKLDGNISIEPDSGMPDFIGDFEYSDVDYEAIIDLTTVYWINWVEGGLFVMNAEETWEEDNGDTSYHQCVVTFIYRANGCIPISIVNTNKMTAKMSGMVITINLTEGTGELRFKQIKLI
jgi:hypothetical protein